MSDEIKINKTTLMLFGLLIVSVFAFYMFTNSNKGVNPNYDYPIDTSTNPPSTNPNPTGAGSSAGVQEIYIKALSSGTYDNKQITVKKGVPVRLHFSADPGAGCGRAMVIYGLNVRAISQNGQEQIVDFTPSQAGTFEYNCGMRMFQPGKLTVV
ncbi:MAG: cupredoxin domain-containing protein [Candidatus Micrarchaeota archaeon]